MPAELTLRVCHKTKTVFPAGWHKLAVCDSILDRLRVSRLVPMERGMPPVF